MQRRTIDNSGRELTLRTRQGADLRCKMRCWSRNAQGQREPLELSQYEVLARVRDDSNAVHTVPVGIDGNALTISFLGALTATLGSGPCNFSVALKRGGFTTPVVYGTITCERSL